MMTQGILFTISQLYYNMDYYSIIISSLAFKVFYGIMYYIDENKDKDEYLNDIEKSKQNKVYHIISHFINLALKFNQNIQAGIISLDNGGLNSISKFILNNFIELIPKCQGIIVPKIFPKYENSTLFQTTFRSKLGGLHGRGWCLGICLLFRLHYLAGVVSRRIGRRSC